MFQSVFAYEYKETQYYQNVSHLSQVPEALKQSHFYRNFWVIIYHTQNRVTAQTEIQWESHS